MIPENKEWKGYTLDELKFRRLLSMTKLEIEKNSIAQHFDNMRAGRLAKGQGWLTKVTGALNYLDYAAIGFTVVRKLIRIFKKK